ncbi:MAG: hypothetical protein LBI75_05275 [Brucellaceae bacterium]|nr:hypothetical protein [Brucellaceae bacterium]
MPENANSLLQTDETKTMIKAQIFIIPALLAASVLLTAPAIAEQQNFKTGSESKRPAPVYSLPGVKPAKPIVTPQPEPEENNLTTNPDGSFNIGNTRVKISGSVIVDVGNTSATHK